METHHGRPGGRGRELLLLLLTLIATIVLIGGGFFVPLLLAAATEAFSPYLASKAGGALGFILSAVLWRKLLAYYRYGPDLKPIRSEKDRK